MKKMLFSPRIISIAIGIVLLLGLFSSAATMYTNNRLLQFDRSITPDVDHSIVGIYKLIGRNAPPSLIQQELVKVAARDEKFGDLLVINQDAIIIAALNPNAAGQPFPLGFRSNTLKVIPLPFDYKSQAAPRRADLYQLQEGPDLMFKVFGRCPSGQNTYYIIGTYQVKPELLKKENLLSQRVSTFLKIYQLAFILFWFLLALWVYMDARRRNSNAAAWGILTLLTSVVGWSVYLVARPELASCSACGREQAQALKYCTACGAALKNCCPQCRSRLLDDWLFCGDCGYKRE